jgi:EpsI family protein
VGDSVERAKAKWIIAGIVTVAAVCAYALRSAQGGGAIPLRLASVVISAPDTSFVDEPLDADFTETLRAQEVLYRMYAVGSREPVWLFLAYFDQQREGSQVHSPRHCYPGSGWSIEREVEMEAGWRDGAVHGIVVSNGTVRRLVCYWFQTPGGIVSDVFRLKLLLTREALMRRPQDVVYANISTPVDDGTDAALLRVSPYLRDAEAQIDRLFREQYERRRDTD